MARSKAQTTLNGFTNGLNTEASVLNVLPSEFMDGTINVELLDNGSIRRRRGLEFLRTSQPTSIIRSGATETKQESPSAIVVRLSSPTGNIVERLVVDMNNQFRIYRTTTEAFADLGNPYQTISRANNSVIYQRYSPIAFAQSGDKLFFAGKYCKPGYLKVADDGDSLEVVYIDVFIRNLEAEAQPSTVSQDGNMTRYFECKKEHFSHGGNEAGDSDAAEWGTYWDLVGGAHPAGTAPWAGNTHYHSRANDRITHKGKWYECVRTHLAQPGNEPGVGGNWQRFWILLEHPAAPNTPSWKLGVTFRSTNIEHIYDRATNVTASSTYPTSVAFFAGRLWLGGDPKYPNRLYFSKTIRTDTDISRFMQAADPFDSEDNELADNDGGVIELVGAGVIKQMVAIGGYLIVGTTNGIYQVAGTSGQSFKATDFVTREVLNDNVTGLTNMVEVENEVMVFGTNNIWLSAINSSTATVASDQVPFVSLSNRRIQSLYDSIPQVCKTMGRAVYDPTSKQVFYFFNKVRTNFDKSFSFEGNPGYSTHCLVVDTDFRPPQSETGAPTGAIWLYEYADNADTGKAYIACPFVFETLEDATQEDVTVGGQIVTTNNGEVVTAENQSLSSTKNIVYVIVMRLVNNTAVHAGMCRLYGRTPVDYDNNNFFRTSFTSKLYGGVQTGGTILNKKVATYLTFLLKKIETGALVDGVEEYQGGALLRTLWNFSENSLSGKYSDQYQIYHVYRHSPKGGGPPSQDGHGYVWWKHRARGRGIAFQFVIENDGDKDFHIIGWSLQLYGIA